MSNESEAATGNTPPDPVNPQSAEREATVSPKKSLDAFLPSILRPVGPKESEPKEPEPKEPEIAPEESDSAKSGDGSPAAGAQTPTAKPADGPYRRETKLPVNPRRVRGGVRMKRKEGAPESWAEQRFWRVAENTADGETLKEGLEYARGGQTRRVLYDGGKAEASVQGRRTRAYTTIVTMPKYTPDQKAEVVRALGEQSRYAAKLLSGELPPSIEDVFVPIGLHLFPSGPDDFELSCSCKEENGPWCKHVVCVSALLAEKLANDPFLIFELRGLPREHLVEGLRDFRALTTLGPGPQPVYAAHVSGLTDTPSTPLEESIHQFWRAPGKGDLPSVPIEPPEVSHPLLRRLGQSPFQESKFPLVGLLATCYELIGRDALVTETDPDEGDDRGLPEADPDPTPPPPPASPDEPPARPKAARALKR